MHTYIPQLSRGLHLWLYQVLIDASGELSTIHVPLEGVRMIQDVGLVVE